MHLLFILRKLISSYLMLVYFNATIGIDLKSNTRRIWPLPVVVPNFCCFPSLGSKKRLPEVRSGFVYIGYKTRSEVLVFLNLTFTQLGLKDIKF